MGARRLCCSSTTAGATGVLWRLRLALKVDVEVSGAFLRVNRDNQAPTFDHAIHFRVAAAERGFPGDDGVQLHLHVCRQSFEYNLGFFTALELIALQTSLQVVEKKRLGGRALVRGLVGDFQFSGSRPHFGDRRQLELVLRGRQDRDGMSLVGSEETCFHLRVVRAEAVAGEPKRADRNTRPYLSGGR